MKFIGAENEINGTAKVARTDDPTHIIRQRINDLMANAAKKPIVTVCAGAGCGKSRAVSDYLRQQEYPFFWLQISGREDSAAGYWEKIVAATKRVNKTLSDKFRSIGFPDTPEKTAKFLDILNNAPISTPYYVVLDDLHLLQDRAVLAFAEKVIGNLSPNLVMVLVCRDLPDVKIELHQLKGYVSEITESELCFTESELTDYFKQQGLSYDSQTVNEIHKDTNGWAFAANLAARSLKNVPMYTGFVKTALKQNLFKLMEAESWETLSEGFRRFLLCLSLVGRVSAELADAVSDGDAGLWDDLKKFNAHIRFDGYGGVCRIQPTYLEFLQTKLDILTDDDRRRTYKAAADWCRQNKFITDALNYYEKIADYASVVGILCDNSENMPYEISAYAAGIFERAHESVAESTDFFAAAHLLVLMRLYRKQEFIRLAESYEKRFLRVADGDFKNHTLGGIYFFWGVMRFYMGTTTEEYDFPYYIEKAAVYLSKTAPEYKYQFPLGAWGSAVGSAKAGAPQAFADAMNQTAANVQHCFNIGESGFDGFIQGELKFYQSNLGAAEINFMHTMECAREHRQYELVHRSLFYIMRIAVMQGNRAKAEQALKDLRELLGEERYSRRFVACDIAFGWYKCILRQQETVPDWIKGDFTPYIHPYHMENFGNQLKARYLYLKRNYTPLLLYIREMKQRESVLYGRVEMLAMEACVRYHMKNKSAAMDALRDAYDAANPNGIVTPFIELGKDMRTLIAAVLRDDADVQNIGIPRPWLESMRHKATTYAKNQSLFITGNIPNSGGKVKLTAREMEVLGDIYHGFSQSEIAAKRSLSVNTIKMITKCIYDKLHVHKITDLIRTAVEQGLV